MITAKFIIITGPGDVYGFARKFNRPGYNCPEAFKWDQDVAKYTNAIINEGNKCTIVTQSQIVVNQFLIALKRDELKVEDVAIYFIKRPDMLIDDEDTTIVKMDVKQYGRIRKPEPGFFEQNTSDLRDLL